MSAGNKPWETEGYSDIVKAHANGNEVEVEFANGDTVIVLRDSLGIEPDDTVGAGDLTTALVVSGPRGNREVDWMTVRSAADPEFAQELRDRDAEESRRIGRRLRALRENQSMTQQAVAAMAGMAPPQLARLERGETDMRLSTLRSVLRALDGNIADIAGPDAPEMSVKELTKRAAKAGAPKPLLTRIADAVGPRSYAAALDRGFRLPYAALLSDSVTTPKLAVQVRLKTRKGKPDREEALLTLARSLSEIAAGAVSLSPRDVPPAGELRAELSAGGGEITFEALVRWVWSAGILLIPMVGPGGFSAAAWRVGAQPVIVIKEAQDLVAYWLFVLAHELGHFAHGHVSSEGVVDVGSPTNAERTDDEEEEANLYALDVLIPDHAALLDEVRRRAEGPKANVRFKFAVEEVAEQAKVSPALLALVAAYDMPDVAEPKDRWGSANNLARLEGSASPVVQRAFSEAVPLDALPALDATLIRTIALSS